MNRALVLSLIIWSAFGVRLLCQELLGVDPSPLLPVKPLNELPLGAVGEGWRGERLPLPDYVVRIAEVADYTYRQYSKGPDEFLFYVGYVTEGASGGLHYPDVCFRTQGLDPVTRETVVLSSPGTPKELRFLETQWISKWKGQRAYSLYSFYYRGGFEPDVTNLRKADRFPGLRYYGIITLVGEYSGSLEETRQTYQDVLRRVVPELLKHFPLETP